MKLAARLGDAALFAVAAGLGWPLRTNRTGRAADLAPPLAAERGSAGAAYATQDREAPDAEPVVFGGVELEMPPRGFRYSQG